jgi:glycerol kinase
MVVPRLIIYSCNFQSDVLNTQVVRPIVTETTALGAAYLAGLAVGVWPSIDALREQWQVEHIFTPSIDAQKKSLRMDASGCTELLYQLHNDYPYTII